MSDPSNNQGRGQELFAVLARQLEGVPIDMIWNVCMNLIVNSIRQTVAERKDAEATIDQLFGRAKSILLDQHYDSVTGKRRTVFPFTQQIKMPFHVND